MLYTYRSIARALPTVSGDEAHKRSMYSASFEVLHPAITRVKTLISFKERAVSKFTSNLALLIRAESKLKTAKGEAPIPCEALYIQLLNTLDMLAVLDALKDTKACLNNDFSTYKRAFQHCRADLPDQEQITTENNLLQPFLANQQTLLTALKTAVHRMPGFDSVLADMATLAIEHLESDWYLLPAEKHRFLRSAAHTLWLLDSPDAKTGNAFQHKKIQRARFGHWFRRYPIVPMYGDMFANLQHILSRCPNYSTINADDLFATKDKKEMAQVHASYDVTLKLPRLRSQVAAFISEFASLLRVIETTGGGPRLNLQREDHTSVCLTLVTTTIRGLKLLSELNALLREALAHKCAHWCDDATLAKRCTSGEWCDYERALRYNLSDIERSALVELLSLLKSLQTTIHKVVGGSETLLVRGIHELCQLFVHETMGGPTRKAVKYEKKALKQSLMQLRNMAADWGVEVCVLRLNSTAAPSHHSTSSFSYPLPLPDTPIQNRSPT